MRTAPRRMSGTTARRNAPCTCLGLWFNANDVCEALELGNPSQAIKSHVDADDLQKLEVIDNLGRKQRANHVNESGAYALIYEITDHQVTPWSCHAMFRGEKAQAEQAAA
jgi:hypothetical protein